MAKSKARALGIVTAVVLGGAIPSGQAVGDTLDAIRSRGTVICGVHPSRAGFATPDSHGTWNGFNVDFCRAIAAATLGDANKVRIAPLSAQQRFPALQSGQVDLLIRNITITLDRETSLGFAFTPPIYYTGTGVVVHASTHAKSIMDLDGAVICMAPGGTTEGTLSRAFAARRLTFKSVVIDNSQQMHTSYVSGRCDALADDKAAFASIFKETGSSPSDNIILPENLSDEPLGIAVRRGSEQWLSITSWVINALIDAEELGVGQANVDQMLKSNNPDIQYLLGTTGNAGKSLGLNAKWAYNMIKQVGNYKDIYDRSFGLKSPLPTPRGLNALHNNGGILYGYPLR